MTKSILERFESKVFPCPMTGCWLWTGSGERYGKFFPTRKKAELAHRFSWEIYNGVIPTGFCVLHHCDVPLCVNPIHLFLGTNKDNTHDCIRKNRFAIRRGQANPLSKLSDNDVRSIRMAVGTQEDIAKRFGISQGIVSYIVNRKSWRHI